MRERERERERERNERERGMKKRNVPIQEKFRIYLPSHGRSSCFRLSIVSHPEEKIEK